MEGPRESRKSTGVCWAVDVFKSLLALKDLPLYVHCQVHEMLPFGKKLVFGKTLVTCAELTHGFLANSPCRTICPKIWTWQRSAAGCEKRIARHRWLGLFSLFL